MVFKSGVRDKKTWNYFIIIKDLTKAQKKKIVIINTFHCRFAVSESDNFYREIYFI